jgi:hypothetical protein
MRRRRFLLSRPVGARRPVGLFIFGGYDLHGASAPGRCITLCLAERLGRGPVRIGGSCLNRMRPGDGAGLALCSMQ